MIPTHPHSQDPDTLSDHEEKAKQYLEVLGENAEDAEKSVRASRKCKAPERQLVSMISTEGKSGEEIDQEMWAAFQKFQEAESSAKKKLMSQEADSLEQDFY
jgi:hypothetical protein